MSVVNVLFFLQASPDFGYVDIKILEKKKRQFDFDYFDQKELDGIEGDCGKDSAYQGVP